MKIQEYLKSPTFTDEETSPLFALRSRTNESFKANFRNLYNNVVPCPLDCWENEETVEDTQPHLLECKKLRTLLATNEIANGDVNYDDIFKTAAKQKEAIVLMKRLLQAKEQAVKSKPPGDNLEI